MSTCLLHAFPQKSGVLFIAFPKQDGFSYERPTCLYSAVLVASIAPCDDEVFVLRLSKLLDQSSVLLLGLAIVLQRLAIRRYVRMLPLPDRRACKKCLMLFVQGLVVLS